MFNYLLFFVPADYCSQIKVMPGVSGKNIHCTGKVCVCLCVSVSVSVSVCTCKILIFVTALRDLET